MEEEQENKKIKSKFSILDSKIELDETEQKLFTFLQQVIQRYNLGIELRVSGGWVRDKILGKSSSDYDFVISNLKITEFAQFINQFMKEEFEKKNNSNQKENSEETSEKEKKFRDKTIISINSNPEKGKNLETVRMKIFDNWIDLTNFRKKSTDPKDKEFGTPLVDAQMRDFTINSLFYNISTNQIEDLTGKGLSDLQMQTITTPLEPEQTFIDDPLRILRAIRFATKYKFKIHSKVESVMKTIDIHKQFLDRISRERVGTEIEKIMLLPNSLSGLIHICNAAMYPIVFLGKLDEEIQILNFVHNSLLIYQDFLSYFFPQLTDPCEKSILYSVLYLPYFDSFLDDGKTPQIFNSMFLSSKSTKKDYNYVFSLFQAIKEFSSLFSRDIHLVFGNVLDYNQFSTYFNSQMKMKMEMEINYSDPKTMEKFFIQNSDFRTLICRFLIKHKEKWIKILLISNLLEIVNNFHQIQKENNLNFLESVSSLMNIYQTIKNEILKMNPEKIWNTKPILSGSEIMKCLGMKKGSSLISKLIKELLNFQLSKEKEISKEEAENLD
ncbi:cca tRNA nucleotidyltransferase [Anaeramoeba ignava]|uniref:Cca tRNA nucleotidyltransferase n=1 Tax=Anaeramoeba ignava TaxID=1746090 RepID=A0A9Q0R912_ANAIG|nr:cca tRNA nucleotidyltransferase [Anaeramoeba ignava]